MCTGQLQQTCSQVNMLSAVRDNQPGTAFLLRQLAAVALDLGDPLVGPSSCWLLPLAAVLQHSLLLCSTTPCCSLAAWCGRLGWVAVLCCTSCCLLALMHCAGSQNRRLSATPSLRFSADGGLRRPTAGNQAAALPLQHYHNCKSSRTQGLYWCRQCHPHRHHRLPNRHHAAVPIAKHWNTPAAPFV